MSRILAIAAAATMSLISLSACANNTDSATSTPGATDLMTVAVSHYPVEFLVERIGGDKVDVVNLTTPGTEPHDVELTPQQVAELQDSAAVFYIGGFQPALDDAIAEASGTTVDLTEGMTLREAEAHSHEEEAEAHSHEEEAEAHSQEEEHSGTDPHVWLDPVLMKQMADTVTETLSSASPEHQQVFADNAAQLQAELESLDSEWSQGTANCAIKTMVVSHEAFGYLADQYGFDQRGIAGLSPENEPSAAAIAELTDFVRDNGVTTVYTEELVDPAVAETIAAEAGAQTALLSTLETQPQDGDYFTAMQANLETVSAGQSCS
jgi:zinc transport system substrate-binding protein